MTNEPLSRKRIQAKEVLELIHIVICGPFPTQAQSGFSYFTTFTDDFLRYGNVYLMKHKSETLRNLWSLSQESKNNLEKYLISKIRSRKKYLSHVFVDCLKSYGIHPQWTPLGIPYLSWVSERRNRTSLDMIRSIMSFSKLSVYLWDHALFIIAYILNQVPLELVE